MTDNKEMPERVWIAVVDGCVLASKVKLINHKSVEFVRADEVESEGELIKLMKGMVSVYTARKIFENYILIKKSGGSNNGNSPV